MLSEKLKNLRLAKGFSQQHVADKVGITKQMISLYETGKNTPTPDTLLALAKFFKVDATELNQKKNNKLVEAISSVPATRQESMAYMLNDRVESLIKALDINQKDFAYKIGEEPNTISHIIKRRIGVSSKVLEGIVRNIKGLNTQWLLSGVGVMFSEKVRALPFYEVDVTAGNVNRIFDGTEIPRDSLLVPGFADCDFAVPVSGHSMYPKISNGDIIICKQVNDFDVVEFGQIYLIVTDERRMVKYVRKASKPDKVLLVSENHERFDDFEIARSKIRRLYLVKGWVNKNEI
jgi:DNA-binding XRE family transcriptional regulator/phage repressor protein C with HTH and peptisase S24 domain